MNNEIENLLIERSKTHGNFNDQAGLSQLLKNIMRLHGRWMALSPSQAEALDMIQHKISRILSGDPNYKDHWVDIIGYSEITINSIRSEQIKNKLKENE